MQRIVIKQIKTFSLQKMFAKNLKSKWNQYY